VNTNRATSTTEQLGSEADWLEIIEETSKLQLSADWDGAGANPIQPALVRSTIAFLERSRHEGQPVPDAVYPLSSGSIIAEWHNEDRSRLSAEIREPGRVELMHWFPDRPAEFSSIPIPESCGSAASPPTLLEEALGNRSFETTA